mmetsp:Transcript_119539/g.283851  ORF Transcript_119539/g.283851 Transcript_119539/m.283851 type:complete len:232 (+) Transcript_119539:1045-1740(+)
MVAAAPEHPRVQGRRLSHGGVDADGAACSEVFRLCGRVQEARQPGAAGGHRCLLRPLRVRALWGHAELLHGPRWDELSVPPTVRGAAFALHLRELWRAVGAGSHHHLRAEHRLGSHALGPCAALAAGHPPAAQLRAAPRAAALGAGAQRGARSWRRGRPGAGGPLHRDQHGLQHHAGRHAQPHAWSDGPARWGVVRGPSHEGLAETRLDGALPAPPGHAQRLLLAALRGAV